MTYQEYFKQADFEDIWYVLYFYYQEDSRLKPYYKALIDSIKELKADAKFSKERITLLYVKDKYVHIEGAPDPQEWLVGREVDVQGEPFINSITTKQIERNKLLLSSDSVSGKSSPDGITAAHLIFWSTLYSFKTHTKYVEDFIRSYKEKVNNIISPIKSQQSFVTESFHKKKLHFWEGTIKTDYAISWEANLHILKKKLEYNIGYWRFVQRHVGWEEDVTRMKICCNLLDAAAKDYLLADEKSIYINGNNASRYGIKLESGDLKQFSLEKLRKEKAFRIVWKYIDHNMKKWWD